ncbi:MAG TPA: hypothetical protein VGM78_16615 [Ilumatobacteraceae bacterium]|jgi:hypothetical protein
MTSTNSAEIGAIADGIETYRARLTSLAETLVGGNKDDLLAALYEAERSLRTAHRAVQRGLKIAR